MDFKRILYFCTIVEQGQISRAAKVLNMSQPPLSQRLKELEEDLGAQLIVRTGGRWEVTEEGKALYRGAQRILSHLSSLRDEVSNARKNIHGEVRIGISARCITYFTRILPTLANQYPGITCRLVVVDSRNLESYLQQRQIDFAILLKATNHDNVVEINLEPQHFVAVYSRLLPPPPTTPSISLEELVKHPILLPRRWVDSENSRPFMRALQARNLSPHILLDTHATYILFDILYETPAIALMHNTEIPKAHCNDFEIRDVDIEIRFHPTLAYLKNAYCTPQAQVVLDLILSFQNDKDDDIATEDS